MLPLYLSIEGLYSYQNKQEIDFSTLTEAGLFGIFGAVGSGKSSILEAISFVLYGETERLNTKEKRAYNMMNLKSNNVLIDFQFLNFENKKFRFVAQWKRKKKFDDITTFERSAYQWSDNSWIPLESTDGALVTKLSYPNFRRTIIIPQGQFKEFLELRGKDRSEMMKEIFLLNQYDLGPKVSYMLADTNKNLERLKGVLSGYEEVNNEILEQKNNHYQELKNSLSSLKTKHETLKTIFHQLETAKVLRLDLHQKEEELSLLEAKKPQIVQIEKQIAEFELVSSTFKEHVNNFSFISTSKNSLFLKIESLKEAKDQLKDKITKAEVDLQIANVAYNQLDNLKAEIEDLKLLSQNIDTQNTLREKTIRIKNGKQFLADQLVNENTLNANLVRLEEEMGQLKLGKINSSDLLAIDSWYQRQDLTQSKIQEEKKRVDNHANTINQLRNKFVNLGYTEANWQEEIQVDYVKLQEKEGLLVQKESNLRLKEELGQYIHNLHEGEMCPLCGSLDHPSPMKTQDLAKDFESLNLERQQISAQQQQLSDQRNELTLASRLILEKVAEQKINEIELQKIVHDSAVHADLFLWTDFKKEDRKGFDQKKTALFILEKKIEDKEEEIKKCREDILKTKEKTQKADKALNQLTNEQHILEAHIAQNLSQLKIVNITNYQSKTKEDLDLSSQSLALKIKKIENDFQTLNQLILELKTQYAQIKGQHSEAQEQYGQWATKLQELQITLNNLLVQFSYPDIATIIEILNKNLNVIDSRKLIQDFYLNYASLENRIKELHKTIAQDQYTDELFEDTKLQVQQNTQELEVLLSQLGGIKEELNKLTVDLQQKIELETQFNSLNGRKENLKLLENMFRGNGFVNYVSGIHLERLCAIANERFHRLTKNQLSLVINENNDFEVIDYLNNGYRRSVKTLSGGQGFQASLCLALALAENIQSLNKAAKNFFFIDEGFGTQDAESIHAVFETLNYLHKENRIVGIISHVEELKERIPKVITVYNDLELGSIIKEN